MILIDYALLKKFNLMSYLTWLLASKQLDKFNNFGYSEDDLLQFWNEFHSLPVYEQKDIRNKSHSLNEKKCMLRKRIEFMLTQFEPCYFVTLTLSDKYINNTLPYLRRCIRSYLKLFNCYFVGNVDYGSNTGRLHFHVVMSAKPDKLKYKFGFIDIVQIKALNSERLASYIMKLVNHASKQSTKNMLLYSQGKFSFKKALKN